MSHKGEPGANRLERTHRCGREGEGRGRLVKAGLPGERGQARPRNPVTEADPRALRQRLPLSPPEDRSQEAHPGFLHCQDELRWSLPGAGSFWGRRHSGDTA